MMQSPGARSCARTSRIVGCERVRGRAHHHRDVHRLRDQVALRGAQRGRVVHAVLDHRRARAADDGVGHLVGDGVEPIAQHFERDRVDAGRRSARASCASLQDAKSLICHALAAARRAPARRHDGRRVVLFDDRAGRRAASRRGRRARSRGSTSGRCSRRNSAIALAARGCARASGPQPRRRGARGRARAA